jgi:hypothetical protein
MATPTKGQPSYKATPSYMLAFRCSEIVKYY